MTLTKLAFAALSLSLVSACATRGQSLPTASVGAPSPGGLGSFQIGGTFRYSLTASETVLTNYAGDSNYSNFTNISGTASYITASERAPTSLIYSGGYLISNTAGQPSASFQNLGISQVYKAKKWNLTGSDFVSYLPSSPVTGISGVAGVGDIGTSPIGVVTGQSILTNYGTRVTNDALGTAEYFFTPATELKATGTYLIQRFINNTGLNNDQIAATVGPNHRIDARDRIGAEYTFSRFSYSGNPAYNINNTEFTTNGVSFEYERVWSHLITSSITVGPQFSTSNNTALLPNRTNFAALVSVNLTGKRTRGSISYLRGVDGGSGVVAGALSDIVNAILLRDIGRYWSIGLSGEFVHSAGLYVGMGAPSDIKTVFGGAQVTRKIGRDFSAYASYTGEKQALSGAGLVANSFNGLANVFGFGLTYAPKALGRH